MSRRSNNSPEQTIAEAKADAIRTLASAASKQLRSASAYDQERGQQLAEQLLELLGSERAVGDALNEEGSS